MKNIKNYSFLLLFSTVFFSGQSIGQVVTNTTALTTFSQAKKTEAENLKAAANTQATNNGIPLKKTSTSGAKMELQYYFNGLPVYNITHSAASTISTNKVYSGGGAGLSLTGYGQTLSLWDEGSLRVSHVEFGTRTLLKDAAIVTNSNHATHVAGTMISTGNNTSAKGMSYLASLNSFDWNNDISEMATEAANGLNVSNNSYGYSMNTKADFGYYNNTSSYIDYIAYNAPFYLPVNSAGNDQQSIIAAAAGYDCLPYGFSTAKNTFTVGSINDMPNGYTTPANVILSSFSSCGPTDDGRIKPDIVGAGNNIYSAWGASNSTYNTVSGTSMASANVSGSIGLLLQHQANLYGSNVKLQSATIKALLIHTADEAGPNPGPDYKFGWGVMNTASAATLMTNSKNACVKGIREYVLNQGQTITIYVKKTSAPLKVTLAWTDPAGTVKSQTLNNRTPSLVNDLDLKLTSNVTMWPWVLNPNSPAAAATTGDNTVDNVEQILLPAGGNATYAITITHKGNLTTGSQAFSLILSGHEDQIVGDALGIAGTINNKLLFQQTNDISFENFTAASTSEIALFAGHEIEFKPNVEFKPGSKLVAKVGTVCNSGALNQYRIDNTDFDESKELSNNYSEITSMMIYPNPASSSIFVKLAQEETGNLIIYDFSGKVIYSKDGSFNLETEIPVTGWSKGLYFVKYSSDSLKNTQKLIVE